MTYNSLINYYKVIFQLSYNKYFSIEEIENLFPFERDIYIDLLLQQIEENKKETQNYGSTEYQ